MNSESILEKTLTHKKVLKRKYKSTKGKKLNVVQAGGLKSGALGMESVFAIYRELKPSVKKLK